VSVEKQCINRQKMHCKQATRSFPPYLRNMTLKVLVINQRKKSFCQINCHAAKRSQQIGSSTKSGVTSRVALFSFSASLLR
ncbi:MAG: hypothetical protein ACJ788_24100, partial [Ktedonobacteraceae bacterium]